MCSFATDIPAYFDISRHHYLKARHNATESAYIYQYFFVLNFRLCVFVSAKWGTIINLD